MMAPIRSIYSWASFGSKIELGFHFGTIVTKTENFTFLGLKKSSTVPKRLLDKTGDLK